MTRVRLLAAAALCGMSACLPLNTAPSPHGATVQVFYAQERALRGELLAVSAESMWVAEGKRGVAGATALPMANVQRVVVQRGAGTGSIAMRGVLFGIGTGLGMFVACNSVSDGCGAVFAISVVVPSALALIAGSGISAKRRSAFSPVTADSLARFARWPQGRPVGRSQ